MTNKPANSGRVAEMEQAAQKYAKQFEGCGGTDVGRRYRSFMYGAQWADANPAAPSDVNNELVEALEFYAARVNGEVAKNALTKHKAQLKGGG